MKIYGNSAIKRYIDITTCVGLHTRDHNIEPYECQVIGGITDPITATVKCRKYAKDDSIIIKSIAIEKCYYTMKTTDFIRFAESEEVSTTENNFTEEERRDMMRASFLQSVTESCEQYSHGVWFDKDFNVIEGRDNNIDMYNAWIDYVGGLDAYRL